jgi:Spy/CpxP family protein refolding chaperone
MASDAGIARADFSASAGRSRRGGLGPDPWMEGTKMASRRLAVTALTALALVAGSAIATRANADQSAGKDHERLAAWASKLGLSNEQQEQVKKICNDCAERADPLEEQLWKLHHEEFDAVKQVLTQEQREKLPAAIKAEMTKEIRMIADKLNLSDDQRQKLATIREECEPKFREVCAQSTDSARKKMHELRSEFFADARRVLTDDQKAKFTGVLRQEFHQWRDPVARHQRLEEIGEQVGVSSDQKAQIQKIMAEYQPKIERTASQLKDIFHEERASIEKVLTDEQRTKAHEMWKAIGGTIGAKSRD